ncbi:hypothetical protein DRW07_13250 [Alteromonas sediminis]|uniref:Uncharacterized protein n=1 Tax=Alteromonas sediminis TaxID=2259342 RepID=A0A3N5Y044_9ALTE|nr:DUF6776 family protein [Alteromonas sediminis]RPJ65776.1 hypothetical protein DRW07_13250 [Alteromonas sediminis]
MPGSAQHSRITDKRYRWSGLFVALLFTLWVGYQLAESERNKLRAEITLLKGNVAALNAENHVITQQVNELNARQSVCDSQLQLTQEAKYEERQTLSACEEQVAFYQHVMAPELSQKLLSVDLMQARWSAETANTINIELVLLQPRTQKSTISGKLKVELVVEGQTTPILLDNIDYRFKFFQQVSQSFTLPGDAVPVALRFSSSVMQYKRVREQYSQEIPWPSKGLDNEEGQSSQ